MRNQLGVKNNNSKLTEIQVGQAKGYLAKGLSLFETQNITGIDRRNLWAIQHRKSWKHIEPDLSVILPVKNPLPTEKRCPKCGQTKSLKEFTKACRPPFFVNYLCKICKNKEAKLSRKNLRNRVLAKYGDACICCLETINEFLSIDHVNGGGNKERKIFSATQILRKLDLNDRLDEYQILCHNCNLAKGFYGECPHQRKENDAK